MFSVRFEGPSHQITDAQFAQLFGTAVFKYNNNSYQEGFIAVNGKYTCNISVGGRDSEIRAIKKLTSLNDILSAALKLEGYHLYVKHEDRNFGFSYEDVRDGANTNNLNISKTRNASASNSNGQIKTPVGGRAYFAESHEDFLDRIEYQLENSSSDFETMQDVVVHLGYGSSKFAKDRAKVDFDLENCDEEDNSPGNEVFMGPQQIKDLNFYGFMGLR